MQVFNHATFLDATQESLDLPSELYSEISDTCKGLLDLQNAGELLSEFKSHIVIIDLDEYDSYDAIVRDRDLPPMVLNSWVQDVGHENYDCYDDGVSCTIVVTDDYGSGYYLILLNDTTQDECILNNFIEAAQNLEY